MVRLRPFSNLGKVELGFRTIGWYKAGLLSQSERVLLLTLSQGHDHG